MAIAIEALRPVGPRGIGGRNHAAFFGAFKDEPFFPDRPCRQGRRSSVPIDQRAGMHVRDGEIVHGEQPGLGWRPGHALVNQVALTIAVSPLASVGGRAYQPLDWAKTNEAIQRGYGVQRKIR